MVVGLTGMSGTGKTTVAALLREQGWPIIDADEIAHEVVEKGENTLRDLVYVFGSRILTKEGELNRRVLAGLAFSDEKALQKLNDITHPAIIHRITQKIEDNAHYAIIDAPLLYETGLDRLCHAVILVTAPLAVRCQRICERDGITKEEALARLSVQEKQLAYETRADFIICNDGDFEKLAKQVQKILQKIMGRSCCGKEKEETDKQ